VNTTTTSVRPACPADVPELLQMMRKLAAFEGYLGDFAVTEADLLQRGFPETGSPEFFAFVATDATGSLSGYAVCYTIPFTYDLRPTLVVKELFVREAYRGKGVGRRLLAEVERAARERGCGLIKWAVLPGNERAERVYRAWGGEPDMQWRYWRREVAGEEPTLSRRSTMSNALCTLFLGSIFVVIVALNESVFADEGMWLFNAPPLKQLKERYHFEPTQKTVWVLRQTREP